jgi:preprotein translocase subunit SecD
MALETRRRSHPVLKAGVIGLAAVVVVLFAFSAVSVFVGAFWTIVKLVLVVAVIAGVIHLARAHFRHA